MKHNQTLIAAYARVHHLTEEHAERLLYPEKGPILTRYIDDRWLLLVFIGAPALVGIVKLIWG